MPVKWVLHWQPNAGTSVNSQILNEVSQCVESINGVKEGRWKATLTFYRPVLRDPSAGAEFPRDFLGISVPEQPNKYYFVIRNQRIVLEADSSIQSIMEKLQSYKMRVALNFEGFQYQLGDFQLRVGKVVPTHSENLRGIVLEPDVFRKDLNGFVAVTTFCRTLTDELDTKHKHLLASRLLSEPCSYQALVEYLPISSIEKSRQMMEEFLDIWQEALSKRSLPGRFMHMEPNFTDYGLADHYTSQHTAVQYAIVMAQLIATVQSVQSMRN